MSSFCICSGEVWNCRVWVFLGLNTAFRCPKSLWNLYVSCPGKCFADIDFFATREVFIFWFCNIEDNTVLWNTFMPCHNTRNTLGSISAPWNQYNRTYGSEGFRWNPQATCGNFLKLLYVAFWLVLPYRYRTFSDYRGASENANSHPISL